MERLRTLLATFLVVLACASIGLAEDVLVLRNGREARGRIVEETDAGVRLDLGAGSMWYRRDQITEVRRGTPDNDATPPATAAGRSADADTREEYALLYHDGRRVGTRTFRAARTPEGFRFEEEVVFLDEKGVPSLEIRTLERSGPGFEPLAFQVRESAGEASQRMVAGEVRSERLWLTVTKEGEKTKTDTALPTGARFPFGARELFLRESGALGGRLEASLYDTRDERWRPVAYEEGGSKRFESDGKSVEVRVVLRRRGDAVEHEWVDDRFAAWMAEINGEALRAMRSTADAVARVRAGETDKLTGPDSAARTRYADEGEGWSIGKPDPSWTFEEPEVRGAGALLSVRNEPLFASVDVLRDVAAPADVTLERSAEALQRLCRAIAPDFRVLRDGYVDSPAGRAYWMEASATTKGERTKTLARVHVVKGRVYRLLAACPESAFDVLRPDLERVLGSFAAR